MKKLLAGILAALFALSLAACEGMMGRDSSTGASGSGSGSGASSSGGSSSERERRSPSGGSSGGY